MILETQSCPVNYWWTHISVHISSVLFQSIHAFSMNTIAFYSIITMYVTCKTMYMNYYNIYIAIHNPIIQMWSLLQKSNKWSNTRMLSYGHFDCQGHRRQYRLQTFFQNRMLEDAKVEGLAWSCICKHIPIECYF